MSEQNAPLEPGAPQSGVRWRRFAVTLGTVAVGAAGMVVLTAQGVLGAQFAISGMPFTVTADRLEGTGFEQFATLDQMIPDSPNQGDTGGQVVVIVSAIDKAELTNLCQSISLGGINLRITAGGSGKPVSARTRCTSSRHARPLWYGHFHGLALDIRGTTAFCASKDACHSPFSRSMKCRSMNAHCCSAARANFGSSLS